MSLLNFVNFGFEESTRLDCFEVNKKRDLLRGRVILYYKSIKKRYLFRGRVILYCSQESQVGRE
jgi:hypothetical protein